MQPITNIAKYTILQHLGSGAYADVYRATDQILRREVALKVLHPRLVADEEAFQRFVQEAQVGASLFHPAIATVLDLGEADGYYYLAMRLVEGESLDKVLREKGAFDWQIAHSLIRQIGSALSFAHQKGLVHRDVKPQNIIVAAEGAVLTDFGLVRALSNTSLTATGAFLGSPSYMAPEIWEGEDASPATDQYAFACVIYEILTAQVLFGGKTPPVVMAKHFKEPDLTQGWCEAIPRHVQEVLATALAKQPTDRFADIAAFVDALLQTDLEEYTLELEPELSYGVQLMEEEEAPPTPKPNPAGIEWVQIPAGEFLFRENKQPCSLPRYYISKYPVTNAQYKLFLDANPEHPLPDSWDRKAQTFPEGKQYHPVVYVSYHDALAFCVWAGCRLPSEEEWEKAARGTDGHKYPWGDQWEDGNYCNSRESGIQGTTPVDAYPLGVSPYGVWDMLGNVWEWTSSQRGKLQILRGGCFGNQGATFCIAKYFNYYPSGWSDVVGFRCATSTLPGENVPS